MRLKLAKSINNTLTVVGGDISKLPKYFEVELVEKRSIPANAIYHVWAKQISDYTGESPRTTTNRMKRDYGLPALANDQPEEYQKIMWMLDRCGYHERTDAQQLGMIEMLPVTRLLSTKGHNFLRDSVQHYWAEQGVYLEYER